MVVSCVVTLSHFYHAFWMFNCAFLISITFLVSIRMLYFSELSPNLSQSQRFICPTDTPGRKKKLRGFPSVLTLGGVLSITKYSNLVIPSSKSPKMPAYALLHTPAYSANAWDSQLAPSKWYKSSEGSLSTPSLWIKPSCASTIGLSTQRKRRIMAQRTMKRKGK